MCRLFLTVLFFFFLTSYASAVDITSIQPATSSPGETILLTGGPFTDQTLVIIGESELLPKLLSNVQLSVKIPDDFKLGDYVIFLAEGETTSQQSFILHLVEPRPSISEVFPNAVESCQPDGSSPSLNIEGTGFSRGARALVDGAAVQLASSSSSHLELILPPLDGGSHRLVVINPGGTESIPQNFVVNTRPEIAQISAGADQVNSYQLHITGFNFHPKLQLSVDGKPITPASTYNPPSNDIFEFIDCSTLVYTRYSVSGQLHRTTFRILNPGGQQSNKYEITIR